MRLSAGAILLALAAVRRGAAPAGAVAARLRELADRQLPDDQAALQSSLRDSFPSAGPTLEHLADDCIFLPVQCAECGARLRAHPWQVGPDARCPVCGAHLLAPRNAAVLLSGSGEALLAAEQRPGYAVRTRVSRFAHFDLVRLLGSGGCGKVYEARNRRSGDTVALKLLEFLPLESRADAFRRLMREACLAARIRHPHIVPVRDVGFGEGVPYVEMDLMPGGSLAGLVERDGALPWRRACALLMEVLSALGASHERGIVHRDLKPDNVLLDGEGRARVSDFGLARLIAESSSTSASRLVGSPHFMAPEQWTKGEVGPRSDIYSAGLAGYYLLTGRLPFGGDDLLSLLYSHLHEPLPAPRDAVRDVPTLVSQAIQKAATKEPSQRFAGAAEFADALREVMGEDA